MQKEEAEVSMTSDMRTDSRLSARPLYIVSDVARLTKASDNQVRHWLKGYSMKGDQYEPFLQAPAEKSRDKLALSFDNLIEVALVTALRAKHLSIQAIRRAHEQAEKEFGPYPFARRDVFVSGKEILMTGPEYVKGQSEHLTTLTKGGQRAWERVLEDYLVKIIWEDGWPVEWHAREFVSLNPEVTFGLPSVNGIRTEIIKSRFLADESLAFIADDFGLTIPQVEGALRYELDLEQAA